MKPAGLLLSPGPGTSALLRLGRAATGPETWHEAYWTAIDEAPASECLGIVARIGQGAGEWRIKPVAVRLDRGSRKTQDVEGLARFDGWVYLIGTESSLETFRSTSRVPRSTIRGDSCSASGSRSPLRANRSWSSSKSSRAHFVPPVGGLSCERSGS